LLNVKYFEVELKDGHVLLKPLETYDTSLDQIRAKMKKLGLSENEIQYFFMLRSCPVSMLLP